MDEIELTGIKPLHQVRESLQLPETNPLTCGKNVREAIRVVHESRVIALAK